MLSGALMALLLLATSPRAQPVSYSRDVRPILERNCMACHACYDAPCQLKLTSPEGLERGASKQRVYMAARRTAADPTRLFVDAVTTPEWRQRGFASVTEGGLESLMGRMLELGRSHAVNPDRPIGKHVVLGLARETDCPTLQEFDAYAKKRPEEGMPLGVTPLTGGEYATLRRWLEQGAPLEIPEDELTAEEATQLGRWEAFLNQPGDRERLMSRYLYEHLFLAHLHLDDGRARRFFELVRSRTPPGSPIDIIPTVRPTSDPEGPVFYRLRKIRGTLVHKTHITYPFGPDRRARYQELFLDVPWEAGELPDYEEPAAVNPFETFAAIPAMSRYRFLLDTAQYFVRTFIRGPVCRGQVATDVIDDHFHALFQSPEQDLFATDEGYARTQLSDLHMPGEKERKGFRFGLTPRWMADQQNYEKRRREAYEAQGRPIGWDYLWRGWGENPDALLTVFRHHDSTTVVPGLVGENAKTVWVMDYPILERIYYLLVVNFDVFGNLTHQLQTRLYFDLLRSESENNYLRMLPRKQREAMRKSWYRGTVASLKRMMVYGTLETEIESSIEYAKGADPRPQFVAGLLRQVTPQVAGPPDLLNRCPGPPCKDDGAPPAQQQVEAELQRLLHHPAGESPFILQLPEVTFLRVMGQQGAPDLAYTLIHNRAHRNVAFMMREESRLEPERNTVTLVRGPLGSYPNFIFRIPQGEVQTFVDGLLRAKDEAGFVRVVEAFGVRRTHPHIWDDFHFFQEYMLRTDPKEAGMHDMNRYANF